MNLVLLGPPGAGKGTQAEQLVEDFEVPCISPGNILREAVRDESALGDGAKEYMDRGDLVPDGLVVAVMAQRLGEADAERGFILDGFPRTEEQAEALDHELSGLGRSLTVALLIDVDEEEAVHRLSGRRVCVKNQHNFHVDYDPPKHADRCDLDGSRLIVRDDDKHEIVTHRLQEYREKTKPLVGYYETRGILHRVDGSRSPTQVSDAIRATLAALRFEEHV